MKLISKILFLCVVLISLTSCEDEPIGLSYSENTPENAQFKVAINGKTFYADISGALTKDGITQIVGKRNDGNKVKMVINGGGEGAYFLGGLSGGKAFYHTAGQETPYDMSQIDTVGSLTISKYDIVNGLASGEFSFVVYRDNNAIPTTTAADSTATTDSTTVVILPDTLKFTQGVFTNIPLHTDLAPPEQNNANFHVKLDGEQFNASLAQAVWTNQQLEVNAENGLENFNIVINTPTETTYDFSETNAQLTYNAVINGQANSYSASQGQLTITEIDEVNQMVSGTFIGDLTAADGSSIVMTEGVFNDVPYTTTNTSTSYVNAHIGLVDYTSSEAYSVNEMNGQITIHSHNNDGDTLSLSVPQDILTGAYPVSETGNYTAKFKSSNPLTGEITTYTTVDNSGSITITERQANALKGTFSFSVASENGEVLQVTVGEFNVSL